MADVTGEDLGEAAYRITLIGPFAVTKPDGRDVTPVGRKSKALIALLALAPNGRRARRWLQDKLWSMAPEGRGAASLRQELTALRKHFAIFGSPIFEATGDDIVLETHRVWLDVRDGLPDPHRDLLEGLDVGDPEFDDWLSEERAYWYKRLDGVKRTVAVQGPSNTSTRGLVPKLLLHPISAVGDLVGLDAFCKSLTEELSVSLHALVGAVHVVTPVSMTRADFTLEGSVHDFRGLRAHFRLTDLHDGTQIWSTRYRFSEEVGPEQVERLARSIVEEIQRNLRDGSWADYWAGADVNSDAWELFQQGRVCESAAQRSALIEAIGFYRAAAQSAPHFIQARISLGFCLIDGVRLCLLGAPTEAAREARAIAEDIARIAPENPFGRALLAFVLCAEGSSRDAVVIMEELITRLPRSSELVSYLAAVHGYCGNYEREQVLYRHALTLSAFPPVWIRTNLAFSLILSGKEGAEDILRVVLQEQPRNPRALIAEAIRLVRTSDISSARAVAHQILVADPDFRSNQWRSKAFVPDPELHRRVSHDLQLAGLP